MINSSFADIKVTKIAKVNDILITNIDIINEIEIIELIYNKSNLAGNPQIERIARDTIIDEILKENEITDKKINWDEAQAKNRFDEIINKLKINTANISETKKKVILKKIKLENSWNNLIAKTYGWQININIEEINQKLKELNKDNNNLDLFKEKEKMILLEKNKKLQLFSKIHLDKLKNKSLIYYYKWKKTLEYYYLILKV